ncbi:putative reverse transcriptase domain-containing protein [Tanacetum coccineum]|uniref:Reverse transcriptase domain-containing protein n=1 Tax=Tanacetum coccineum TaxID=301880 RepID=A0ABQ4Z3Z5_9ASTR
MNFETRSSHVRIDRGGSFSSQIHGPALEENGTRHKLTNVLGTFGELHRRSDLVEISNVSMRVFFVMSKELLVLNEGKQTVLKLKVVRGDLGNNDGILDYKMDRLARIYLNEIVVRHSVPILIISNRDSRFTSRFWQSMQEALETWLDLTTAYHPQINGQSERTIQTLKDMLRACVLDFGGSWDVHLSLVEFSYNNSYHSNVRCASFEALYGRKCRSPIMWTKIGEGQLIRPELVQETTEKISQIKDRLKVAWDSQKSYTDKRRKPLEFSVEGETSIRFVGPFEIIEKVGPVAYRLDLPEELNGVHDMFHMSNLKKCLADPTLQVPLDEIQVDAKLNFMEEPAEILEREFKKLKWSRIAIVKVWWNSKRGPEFT